MNIGNASQIDADSNGVGDACEPSPDSVPNAFTFNSVNPSLRNTIYTSNSITVTGINVMTNVTTNLGSLVINGVNRGASGSVGLNDTVAVVVRSSTAHNATVTATVTIGGGSATFSVTTYVTALAELIATGSCPECDLSGANLAGMNLTSGNLTRANLTGADLTGCYCLSTKFRNATLINANLTNLNTTVVGFAPFMDFSYANLTGANLTGAYLEQSSFVATNLSSTNLTNANFTGSTIAVSANLTGATVSNTIFSGVLYAAYWTNGVLYGTGTCATPSVDSCVGVTP